MTLLEDKKDVFLRQFEDLDRKRRPRHYDMQRRLGRGLFGDLGFPGAKTEDWRFTNVAPLLRVPFALAEPNRADLPLPLPAAPDAVRLVFVNGVYSAEESRIPAALRIAVGSLAQPAPEHLRQIESLLGQIADPSDHVFTALNAGLVSDGAYILLPPDTAFIEPIEIIYCTAGGAQPVATYPRTLIFAGRASQARIVERYVGKAGGVYLTDAVTEIVVEQGANVDHYKVQEESLGGNHLANTQVVQKRDSVFTSHYVSRGAALARNETRVRFDGQGCTATVNGLYVARGKQHVDNFTVIDHAQPHCASHELYKGVLDGEAHGVFNGKARPNLWILK